MVQHRPCRFAMQCSDTQRRRQEAPRCTQRHSPSACQEYCSSIQKYLAAAAYALDSTAIPCTQSSARQLSSTRQPQSMPGVHKGGLTERIQKARPLGTFVGRNLSARTPDIRIPVECLPEVVQALIPRARAHIQKYTDVRLSNQFTALSDIT